VTIGRMRRPRSISIAVCFFGLAPSRLYQCTKSPEPQSRHFPRIGANGRSVTDRMDA